MSVDIRFLKIDIQIFPRKESIAFLLERTGIDDSDSAHTLAETLGDLPLALLYFVSNLKNNRLPRQK